MAQAQQSRPPPQPEAPQNAQDAHPNGRSSGRSAGCRSGRFLVAIGTAVVDLARGAHPVSGSDDAGDPPDDPHRPTPACAVTCRCPSRIGVGTKRGGGERRSLDPHTRKRLAPRRVVGHGRLSGRRGDHSHQPIPRVRSHRLGVCECAGDHPYQSVTRVYELGLGAGKLAGNHAHKPAWLGRILRRQARHNSLERRGPR
jgi:hypothetical protein